MTPESHVAEITRELDVKLKDKYTKGQQEHGGYLWNKNTLPMMEEELIDQITYLHVHQKHIKTVIALLSNGINNGCWYDVQAAFNVLTQGHQNGT